MKWMHQSEYAGVNAPEWMQPNECTQLNVPEWIIPSKCTQVNTSACMYQSECTQVSALKWMQSSESPFIWVWFELGKSQCPVISWSKEETAGPTRNLLVYARNLLVETSNLLVKLWIMLIIISGINIKNVPLHCFHASRFCGSDSC